MMQNCSWNIVFVYLVRLSPIIDYLLDDLNLLTIKKLSFRRHEQEWYFLTTSLGYNNNVIDIYDRRKNPLDFY